MPNSVDELEDVVRSLEIDDAEPSESDTDSASTPAGSPSQKARASDKNRHSTQSFGLHSPDGLTSASSNFQVFERSNDNGSPIKKSFVI